MTTARLVRETRRAASLTQRELAEHSGVTQSVIAAIESASQDTRGAQLIRLLSASGYRLVAIPTTALSAADWADIIYRELRQSEPNQDTAFRALIGLSDDLVAAAPPTRVALCVTPPALCGDSRLDAALAGVVDYHLSRSRLPIPEWVRESTRVLKDEWVVSPYTDPDDTPPAIRRHGVRLAASELASV